MPWVFECLILQIEDETYISEFKAIGYKHTGNNTNLWHYNDHMFYVLKPALYSESIDNWYWKQPHDAVVDRFEEMYSSSYKNRLQFICKNLEKQREHLGKRIDDLKVE